MTRCKSLIQNLKDGIDVQRHRTHRSKKGRNNWNKADSPFFKLYKKKKWLLKNQNPDEILA